MTPKRNVRAQRYVGTVRPIGNSKGIPLDAEFFKAHPEFNGKVDATVIADGQVLLSARTTSQHSADDEIDPVMLSFLGFLQKQNGGTARNDQAGRSRPLVGFASSPKGMDGE